MKKFFAVITILSLALSAKVFADDSAASTANASVASTSSASTAKHSKKKKSTVQPTPQVTLSPTAVPTLIPVVTAAKMAPTSVPTMVPPPYSSNIQLYDRVGAPGDLRLASALAVKTLGSSFAKHDRSVFLWLGRVMNGDSRVNNYVRFNLNGIELGGPRKPWVILSGSVYDQAGTEFKAGDSIEVAVDFRDVKVDYEGTKLGEIQKGNDIADQFYELLGTHGAYQWVLIAQDRVKDEKNMSAVPAFVANAKEGYTFLEPLNLSRDHASSNPAER